MEKDPEKRYQTTLHVAEELARYLNHETNSGSTNNSDAKTFQMGAPPSDESCVGGIATAHFIAPDRYVDRLSSQ